MDDLSNLTSTELSRRFYAKTGLMPKSEHHSIEYLTRLFNEALTRAQRAEAEAEAAILAASDATRRADDAEHALAHCRAKLDAALKTLNTSRSREAAAKRRHNQYVASVEATLNDLRNNGCPHCGSKITLPDAAELRAQLDAARTTNQWWPWITAPLHTPIVIGYEASIDNTEAPVYGRIIGWLPAAPDAGQE